MTQHHWLKSTIVGLTFTAMTSIALASGSDAVGAAQTGDRAAYNLGKRVYAVKIACESCPMAGKKLNKDTAKIMLMSDSKTDLTTSEEKALTIYLKRRFRL